MGAINNSGEQVFCIHCNRKVDKACFFIVEIDECKTSAIKKLQDDILKDKEDGTVG